MTHPNRVSYGSFYILLFAVLFQGLSGIAGGLALLSDPSGSAIGLPVEWLHNSPFTDYLIPGLILFSVLGIIPMIIGYSLWQGKKYAVFGALVTGLGLLIWIAVEILFIGYHSQPPLQLLYGLLGIIIIVFSAVLLKQQSKYQ